MCGWVGGVGVFRGRDLREAAEREGRARHRLAREGVHLLQRPHAVLPQQRLHRALVRRPDPAQHHVLVRRQPHVHVEPVHNSPQARLEPECALVLDAALLHVDAEEQVAVALLVPAQPVLHPPGRQRHPRLHLFARVRLYQRAEVVHANRVQEVLEPRVGAHLPADTPPQPRRWVGGWRGARERASASQLPFVQPGPPLFVSLEPASIIAPQGWCRIGSAGQGRDPE